MVCIRTAAASGIRRLAGSALVSGNPKALYSGRGTELASLLCFRNCVLLPAATFRYALKWLALRFVRDIQLTERTRVSKRLYCAADANIPLPDEFEELKDSSVLKFYTAVCAAKHRAHANRST